MKKGNIILSAVAGVLAITSAFAFKPHAKFAESSLYTTPNKTGLVQCSSINRNIGTCSVTVTLYTTNGAKFTGTAYAAPSL